MELLAVPHQGWWGEDDGSCDSAAQSAADKRVGGAARLTRAHDTPVTVARRHLASAAWAGIFLLIGRWPAWLGPGFPECLRKQRERDVLGLISSNTGVQSCNVGRWGSQRVPVLGT